MLVLAVVTRAVRAGEVDLCVQGLGHLERAAITELHRPHDLVPELLGIRLHMGMFAHRLGLIGPRYLQASNHYPSKLSQVSTKTRPLQLHSYLMQRSASECGR